MEFHNAVNEPPKDIKTKVYRPPKVQGVEVLVDDSVVFIYDKGDTESYDNIRTLADVIELHSAKPNVLLGIKPALYSSFMDNRGNIVPYVKVGDRVKYKLDKHADENTNPIKTISRVYFKSLGDMSIICADFVEGSYALTHLLTVVNED